MLDQDPLYASKRAAERRAICLDLLQRLRADAPSWFQNIPDAAAMAAAVDDVGRALLKMSEGASFDEAYAALTEGDDLQGGDEELSPCP